MKVGLFDPYLDIIGGGERYVSTIAECLSQDNDVYFYWKDKDIKEKLETVFNLDLSNVKFINNPLSKSIPFIKKYNQQKQYDCQFILSDGSIPLVFAKKNFLHFQFPVNWVNGKTFLTKIKLKQYKAVICNSYYTKKFIDKTFNINSIVIYPPVDTDKFLPGKKEKIILSVGRFTKSMHNKNQNLLIEAFKKFFDKGNNDWKYIIIGNLNDKENNTIDEIKKNIKNYPIEIIPNAPFAILKKIYSIATIFWHGTGLGIDTNNMPEKTEHFGISIVEAMSSGCIPFVVNNGGQTEIVENEKSGFYYSSLNELIDKTDKIAKQRNRLTEFSKNAIEKSHVYSKNNFCLQIKRIMGIS